MACAVAEPPRAAAVGRARAALPPARYQTTGGTHLGAQPAQHSMWRAPETTGIAAGQRRVLAAELSAREREPWTHLLDDTYNFECKTGDVGRTESLRERTHLVQHAAQRPDVRFEVVGATLADLRRKIVWRACQATATKKVEALRAEWEQHTDARVSQFARVVERACDAKVADLEHAALDGNTTCVGRRGDGWTHNSRVVAHRQNAFRAQ